MSTIYENIRSIQEEYFSLLDQYFVTERSTLQVLSEPVDDIHDKAYEIAKQGPLVSFEGYDEFEIVGDASNGEEAVRLTLELSPDLVIMDISMPKLNGLEATKQIKMQCPDTLVMILTVYDDWEHIFSIFDAGAAGYLIKTSQSDEIIQSVRGLVAGDIVLSPTVFMQLLRRKMQLPFQKNSNLDVARKLSAREVDIITLASRGLSNKEIAYNLNISVPTVKHYLKEIFNKLNVQSRTEAVITALKAGIIDINELYKNHE